MLSVLTSRLRLYNVLFHRVCVMYVCVYTYMEACARLPPVLLLLRDNDD
jgi:hypothetical protein